MSINFEDPMNEKSSEFIRKVFVDADLKKNLIAAMDDKTVLVNDLQIKQKEMGELARLAKQTVTVEVNDETDIKTMSDGTKYRCTPRGWIKLPC